MPTEWIILIVLLSLVTLFFLLTFICYYIVFFIADKKIYKNDEFEIPPGKAYLEHQELLISYMKDVRQMSYQEFQIKSFDNLNLVGRYYECEAGRPIEIMFHGYRGNSERDLCGGVKRAFALKHNVLLVDQRASSKSDGRTTTFGVNERKDALKWAEFISEKFPNNKIILTGVSMGAATVILASELDLPDNVIGVLADCSYTSQKDIIKTIIKTLKLPTWLVYPFIKWGAKIYGRFNLEERAPIDAIKNAKVKIIIFHGEDDSLVPCYMGKELYEANQNNHLVLMPKAGHCLCYLADSELYLNEMRKFFNE